MDKRIIRMLGKVCILIICSLLVKINLSVQKVYAETPAGGWIEDNANIKGFNYDSSKTAENPSIMYFNDEWYAAWVEKNPSDISQIRVAKRSSTNNNWVFIDGGGTNGINYNKSQTAGKPKLAVYNNKLYIVWSEYASVPAGNGGDGGTRVQIRVARYDGDAWSFVDNKDSLPQTGISYNTSLDSEDPSVASDSTGLYIAWDERNNDREAIMQVHVAKYDGTNWSIIGANSQNGINVDSTKNAKNASIATDNGNLYVTWQEGYNKIYVKKYDGSTWTLISGAQSLNYNQTQTAQMPKIAIVEKIPCVSWFEVNSKNICQVRVKKYNDDNTWSFIDGGGESGMNFNSAKDATYTELKSDGINMYLAWNESSQDAVTQLRIKKYNVTDGWSNLDSDGISAGGDNTGINMDTHYSVGSGKALEIGNGQLCAAYVEGKYPIYQMQFKKYNPNFSIPSNSDELSNIKVSEGELYPAFDSQVYDYRISVGKDTTSINITPTLASQYSKLIYSNGEIQSGSSLSINNLAVGDNHVLIKLVTKEASIVKYINIIINRAVSDTQRIIDPINQTGYCYSPYGNSVYTEGNDYSWSGNLVDSVGYDGNMEGENKSVLKFDYSFISNPIIDAKLKIYINSVVDESTKEDPLLSLYSSNDASWIETSSTMPNPKVNIITNDIQLTGNTWKTFDVFNTINGQPQGVKFIQFILEGNAKGNNDGCAIFTYNHKLNSSNKPTLLITYNNSQKKVPDKPTNVTASAANGKATIKFKEPANDGESGITNYKVEVYSGITKIKTVTNILKTSTTITGLTNGTPYTFKVIAVNEVGDSDPSDASNVITPVTSPSVPRNVTATAGDRQVAINFDVPVSDGGSAIKGYTVIVNPGGIIVSGTSSPIIVKGLTNGKKYTFTIKAVNEFGGSSVVTLKDVIPIAP